MHARMQKIGDGIGLLLSPEEAEVLSLRAGDTVEILKTSTEPATVRYAAVNDAFDAYKRTEPQFAGAYLELAK